MKRVLKATLALMATLTVVYAGVVVYVNANSGDVKPLYGAFEYKSETPPTVWYMPDQLGIVSIEEYECSDGSYWLHVEVDPEKQPFPLQKEQPIFLYKDVFYQVSPLWVTSGLPDHLKQQWQGAVGGTLGVGWILTGLLFLKL